MITGWISRLIKSGQTKKNKGMIGSTIWDVEEAIEILPTKCGQHITNKKHIHTFTIKLYKKEYKVNQVQHIPIKITSLKT